MERPFALLGVPAGAGFPSQAATLSSEEAPAPGRVGDAAPSQPRTTEALLAGFLSLGGAGPPFGVASASPAVPPPPVTLRGAARKPGAPLRQTEALP